MLRRRIPILLGAVVVAAALVLPSAAAATPIDGSRPPSGRKDLVAIFGPKVRRFGLRITRAALVDRTEHRDPRGTHLAIYVEPTAEYTPQDYIDGTVEVTRVFLPYVFARWKGLRSFDVCQEPRPAVDDRPAPPPETQVFASRHGSGMVDWSDTDVATLVATSNAEAAAAGAARPVAFSLYVAAHLKNTPAYQAAVGAGPDTTSPAPATHAYG